MILFFAELFCLFYLYAREKEKRFRVAEAEWGELADHRTGVVVDFREREHGIYLLAGRSAFALHGVEEFGEVVFERVHGILRGGKSACKFVSAEVDEMLSACRHEIDDVDRAVGTARAFDDSVAVRAFAPPHKCGSIILVHDLAGHEPENTHAPARIADDDDRSERAFGELMLHVFHDGRDEAFAFVIYFGQMVGRHAGLECVALGEQLECTHRRVHARGGVEARRDHEGDVVFGDGTLVDVELTQKLHKARTRRLLEYLHAESGNDSILPRERNHIGERGEAGHVEHPFFPAWSDGVFFRIF